MRTSRFRNPPLINTVEELAEEMQLLEALAEVETAASAVKQQLKEVVRLHPADRNYARLKCDIQPLDPAQAHYKLIENYLRNTHGPTHRNYEMKLQRVFCLQKEAAFESGLENQWV